MTTIPGFSSTLSTTIVELRAKLGQESQFHVLQSQAKAALLQITHHSNFLMDHRNNVGEVTTIVDLLEDRATIEQGIGRIEALYKKLASPYHDQILSTPPANERLLRVVKPSSAPTMPALTPLLAARFSSAREWRKEIGDSIFSFLRYRNTHLTPYTAITNTGILRFYLIFHSRNGRIHTIAPMDHRKRPEILADHSLIYADYDFDQETVHFRKKAGDEVSPTVRKILDDVNGETALLPRPPLRLVQDADREDLDEMSAMGEIFIANIGYAEEVLMEIDAAYILTSQTSEPVIEVYVTPSGYFSAMKCYLGSAVHEFGTPDLGTAAILTYQTFRNFQSGMVVRVPVDSFWVRNENHLQQAAMDHWISNSDYAEIQSLSRWKLVGESFPL
jgi:hypothetical protein